MKVGFKGVIDLDKFLFLIDGLDWKSTVSLWLCEAVVTCVARQLEFDRRCDILVGKRLTLAILLHAISR